MERRRLKCGGDWDVIERRLKYGRDWDVMEAASSVYAASRHAACARRACSVRAVHAALLTCSPTCRSVSRRVEGGVNTCRDYGHPQATCPHHGR